MIKKLTLTNVKALFSSLIILMILSLFSYQKAKAQCGYNSNVAGTIFPSNNHQNMNCVMGGQDLLFAATAGTTYYFSFCTADGGSAAWNTEITIFDNSGVYAGGYNDDFCGLQSFVSWVAPSSANYEVQVNQFPCTTNSTCAVLVYWANICPTITVNATATPSTVCSGNNSQLNASASEAICTYNVSSIPFAPVFGVGTAVSLDDDSLSGAIPIGFTFNFYCNDYTNCFICSNGFIEMTSDGSASFLPVISPDPFPPNSFIAPCWTDLVPQFNGHGAGTIDYFTTGVSPNRIFVVQYNGVAEYGSLAPAFTGEVLLYETTNVIEFHTTSLHLLTHSMLEGVENNNGTVGTAVPGRNLDSVPSIVNDAWRFTYEVPTYTYSWNPPTFLTNPNISNPIATGVTSSTDYLVIATDGNNCTGTAIVSVVVDNPTATITPSGATDFCTGGNVTLTANNGSSYLWSDAETTQSIVVSSSGTYTVAVTDGLGCSGTSSSTTVTVTPYPTPTVTTGGPTTFCSGGNVTLTSSTGNTYLWSDGETTQSITVTASGNYTVSVTNGPGCTGTSSSTTVTVNPLPNPIITPSGTTTFCIGDSVILTSTAGTSYLWNDGETTQSITVNSSGTFTVTLTDGNGCVGTSATAITITVNPLPVITITPDGPTTFCQGGSVNLTASSGNGYLWSDGETTQSINVTASGNYSVTVSNPAGCTNNSGNTTITVNPLPNPTITTSGSTVFCAGGSVTLTSTAGNAYLWNDGETTQSIIVNSTGTYTVTMTDGNGCSGTSQTAINVTENPNPFVIVDSTGPTTFCQGGSVTLVAFPSGNYLWSDGETSQLINVTTTGNYSVTVTSIAGCTGLSGTTIVTVYPLPNPTITASGATTFCSGDSVILTSSPGASYLWSDGESTQSITVFNSGIYSIILTDANGCVGTSQSPISVTVNPTPVATITAGGPTVFCSGGSVTLTSSAGNSYLWSTGSISQSILVNTSGNYSVTVTSVAGCTGASSSTTVTVNPLPNPIITENGPTTFCEGGSVILTSIAGSSYLWNNGATTQSITVSNSGTYTVTLTDGNGCVGTSQSPITITVNPNPVVTIDALGQTTFCVGGSVTLISSAGSSFLWNDGEITQSINVTTTGTYSVIVTNAAGCTAASSSSISVTVNPNPIPGITASGPITFCQGGAVMLTATGGGTYSWTNSATTSSINVISSGTYTVTVTNAFGCFGTSAPITVTVNIPTPATITPSGSTTICNGNSITLTSTSGSNYFWNTGANTQSIVVSTAGSFDVTVTDANGCTSVSNIINTAIGTSPTASAEAGGSTTFCPGDSVLLTVNTNSIYLWSNGATTQTIYVTTSGTFTVTVTNANGCTAVSNPIVTTIGAVQATITTSGPTTYCQGGNVTLFANIGTSYLWSNGATTQSIFIVNASGTYSVTVTYPGNCNSPSGSVDIIILPAPVITISTNPDNDFCLGDTVSLTANAIGEIIWSTGDTTHTIICTLPQIYTASVTNAEGCIASSSVTLIGFNPPVASFTTVQNGNTINFTSTSNNALDYLWYFGDGNSSNAPNPDYTYLFGNTYYVELIVSNPCGSDTAYQTIVVTGIDELALDNAVKVYPNPTDKLITVSLTGFSGKHVNYMITDIIGHAIHNEDLEIAENKYLATFDFATYSKGVYLLKVKTEAGILTKKIILQ